MIKRVQSYETADGKLHSDKPSALTHQLMLDVRGIAQSNTVGRAATITVSDLAQFIASHAGEISTLLSKYKEQMRHASK